MNDRALLERAARALGMPECIYPPPADLPVIFLFGGGREWNPLTDDGDALRLAVELSLHVLTCRRMTLVTSPRDMADVTEPHGGDPHAATRRAIVRAAAEIGKTKS